METIQQRPILISILITLLICLLIALSLFTWNLSREMQAMREAMTQTSTPVLQAATNNNTGAPTVNAPVASDPGQTAPAGRPDLNDPFAAPLPQPFARNWPGFMDPSGQIAEMQQRMDELMSSMTQGYPFFNQQDFGFGFINSGPNISMSESSDAYEVSIDVPAGQQVELNTELNNNTLVISGSIRSEREENSSGLSSRSMQESRFSQSLYLPGDINEEAMTIDQQDEQIIVTVPKA